MCIGCGVDKGVLAFFVIVVVIGEIGFVWIGLIIVWFFCIGLMEI